MAQATNSTTLHLAIEQAAAQVLRVTGVVQPL